MTEPVSIIWHFWQFWNTILQITESSRKFFLLCLNFTANTLKRQLLELLPAFFRNTISSIDCWWLQQIMSATMIQCAENLWKSFKRMILYKIQSLILFNAWHMWFSWWFKNFWRCSDSELQMSLWVEEYQSTV